MNEVIQQAPATVRDRLLGAAYRLFSNRGVGAVGIDAIVAESGCAKSSLYNNFDSKEDLVLAFLQDREVLWTREWLESGIQRAAGTPDGRLLAIFDVFDDWFRSDNFEGCAFVNILLESAAGSPVRSAAAQHLAVIRGIVRDLAQKSGLVDPEAFAQVWHMLMKGSIVSAGEGNKDAAVQARRAGRLILESWARSW